MEVFIFLIMTLPFGINLEKTLFVDIHLHLFLMEKNDN